MACLSFFPFPHPQELIKPTVRLSEQPTASELAARSVALSVLFTCLDHGLKLLHPFMPFITEELYHRLPGANVTGGGGRGDCGSIRVQRYPSPSATAAFQSAQLDATMALLQSIAHSARSTRSSLNLTKQRLTMFIRCGSEEIFDAVKKNAKDIAVMAVAQETFALRTSATHTAVHTFFPLPSPSAIAGSA